jgi:chloride channel 3/4/5
VFLLLSAVIKVLLTIITFGNPVPGGVIVPSLVIGGLVGRAVGFALQVPFLPLLAAELYKAIQSADTTKNSCVCPKTQAATLIGQNLEKQAALQSKTLRVRTVVFNHRSGPPSRFSLSFSW